MKKAALQVRLSFGLVRTRQPALSVDFNSGDTRYFPYRIETRVVEVTREHSVAFETFLVQAGDVCALTYGIQNFRARIGLSGFACVEDNVCFDQSHAWMKNLRGSVVNRRPLKNLVQQVGQMAHTLLHTVEQNRGAARAVRLPAL